MEPTSAQAMPSQALRRAAHQRGDACGGGEGRGDGGDGGAILLLLLGLAAALETAIKEIDAVDSRPRVVNLAESITRSRFMPRKH